jgi:hypothetical protein
MPVDVLAKIALSIQEPDRDEAQVQITCRLAVISRQNAEAARVDRKALVKSVLGRKIRNEVIFIEPRVQVGRGRTLQVDLELREQCAVLA